MQEYRQNARYLINVTGPWVSDILKDQLGQNSIDAVRLVRGSHLVVKKQCDHDKAYFLRGKGGRIIFAIPYEHDFTLIGTTDIEHDSVQTKPTCTDEERDYLLEFANQYFNKPLTKEDIVWRFSGVRSPYQDGASHSATATRDYVLKADKSGAPLLTIFGGKITTYRKLAENVMNEDTQFFGLDDTPWTANIVLPDGNFQIDEFHPLIDCIIKIPLLIL